MIYSYLAECEPQEKSEEFFARKTLYLESLSQKWTADEYKARLEELAEAFMLPEELARKKAEAEYESWLTDLTTPSPEQSR